MFPRERDHEVFRFVIHALIRSQVELRKDQDEEVNVYLAHLLLFLASPSYQQWALGYVRKEDSSVYDKAMGQVHPEDLVRKYFTYKVNADYLLTSLGIFQNLGKIKGGVRRFYEQKPEIYIGRGKAYYDFAAEYNHQIYRRKTALEEILHKLSFSFEEYLQVLTYMRSSYFDFVERIPGEEFTRWLRQMENGEGK